jgi:diphthamide synthase (EF-2-diphthine--ammonia ligase)
VVIGLLTTVNQLFNRIAMHGVRRELLESQARTAGLPLWVIPLPSPCANEHYERRMLNALHFLKGLGIDVIAFGDLYLQDIRAYREKQFGNCGLELIFPLWELPTGQLARDMLSAGLKARLSCVDPRAVPAELAGREYNEELLAALPASADPCAENGEFHTFVYSGPMFRSPIKIMTGEIVERDGFVFADLLPEGTLATPETFAGPEVLVG